MTEPVKNIANLKKRLNRFLRTNLLGRNQVRVFLDELSSIGDIVIFGGMLRELSISGNLKFKSDIDVVIDVDTDLECSLKFQNLISEFPVERNKFGGYRIKLDKWKLDIWRLSDTWAFKHGHVKCENFESLCNTTFFSWDAIIYNYRKKEIHTIENYFELLNQKLLDTNLPETPNDLANAVKALRYQEMYSANFSPDLACFLYNVIKNTSYKELYEYEKKVHDWPVLEEQYINDMAVWLVEHSNTNPLSFFSPPHSYQGTIR